MITELLLLAFAIIVRLPFKLLPNIPPFPAAVHGAISSFLPSISEAVQFVQYLYGPTFFSLVFVIGMGLFWFYSGYHVIMWVVRKVPGGMS